jgi:hypothetical protein
MTQLVDAPIALDVLETKLSRTVPGDTSTFSLQRLRDLAFSNAVKAREMTASAVYGFEMSGRWAVLDSPHLSRIGTAIAARPAAARRSGCGNEVITRAELGGTLYVALSFQFKTKASKEQFERDVDLQKASLPNVTGKLRRLGEEYTDAVSVTLAAYQLGGEPTKLATIFGGGDMSLLQCQVTSLQGCADAIAAVRDYVIADNGFRAQLTVAPGGPSPRGPVVLRFQTASYASLGIRELATPELDGTFSAAAAATQRLKTAWESRRRSVQQTRALLDSIGDGDRRRAEALLHDGETSLARLRSYAEACAANPAACSAAVTDLAAVDPALTP